MKRLFWLLFFLFTPAVAHAQFTGTKPCVTMTEIDQTSPLGRWRECVDGDRLLIEKNTATNGGFGTVVQYLACTGGACTVLGLIGAADMATLTNKTISGANNTLTVRDVDLTVTDVTTNNVTASAHGLMTKLSGNATDCYKGNGTYSTCATATSQTITIPTWQPCGGSTITSANTGNTFYTIFPPTGTPDACFNFEVPQAWDGTSNFTFNVVAATSTAVASSNVRMCVGADVLTTGSAVNTAGAVGGCDTYAWANATTAQKQTATNQIVTGAQAATKGNIVVVRYYRDNTVGTNHTGDLRVIRLEVRYN